MTRLLGDGGVPCFKSETALLLRFIYSLGINVCLASMCASAAYVHTDQKVDSDALGLSLGMVVNHVGDGNGPCVLCRNGHDLNTEHSLQFCLWDFNCCSVLFCSVLVGVSFVTCFVEVFICSVLLMVVFLQC